VLSNTDGVVSIHPPPRRRFTYRKSREWSTDWPPATLVELLLREVVVDEAMSRVATSGIDRHSVPDDREGVLDRTDKDVLIEDVVFAYSTATRKAPSPHWTVDSKAES
jgi:hypothetical protein